MKIGILTFYSAHNYGAVLQAYATQEFLKKMGHTAIIVNDNPSFLNCYHRAIWRQCVDKRHPIKTIKQFMNEFKIYKLRSKRWEGFDKFIKNKLSLSSELGVPSDLDAYIVGSDQVWNCKITKGFYPYYYCDFPFKKGHRRYIAYAASMENIKLSEPQKITLSKLLKNFDFVGVREKEMINLLNPLVDKPICQTVDPTLLVEKNIWESLAAECKKMDAKYLLLYDVWNNQWVKSIAEQIALTNGWRLITLVSWLDKDDSKNNYQAANPIEFVSLIKNAQFVMTDSFHGTAFSLIFEKNFLFLKMNDGQNRAVSLLEELGLEQNILTKNDSVSLIPVDYTEVNVKLQKMQEKSRSFLFNSLNSSL